MNIILIYKIRNFFCESLRAYTFDACLDNCLHLDNFYFEKTNEKLSNQLATLELNTGHQILTFKWNITISDPHYWTKLIFLMIHWDKLTKCETGISVTEDTIRLNIKDININIETKSDYLIIMKYKITYIQERIWILLVLRYNTMNNAGIEIFSWIIK